MTFTPESIAPLLSTPDFPVVKIIVSHDLAKTMTCGRFSGTNPFDNYFDCVNDKLTNKSLLGYLWGKDVFVDHSVAPKTLLLNGLNDESKSFYFGGGASCQEPAGYRLEWKPGEYVHESPEDYARETCREGARVWPLYTTPQPGCSSEVAVYKGRFWVQPKYAYSMDLTGFTPLYLGPVIHEPT